MRENYATQYDSGYKIGKTVIGLQKMVQNIFHNHFLKLMANIQRILYQLWGMSNVQREAIELDSIE